MNDIDLLAVEQLPTSGSTNIIINNPFKLESEIVESVRSWTTPGTYTWTAPSYVSKIRITVCGGGGGGKYISYGDTTAASSGRSSSFGAIIATGGAGGYSKAYLTNPDHSQYSYAAVSGAGGTPNGLTGQSGTGFALNHNMETGTYGAGGQSYRTIWGESVAGGGSGGYISTELDVTPNTTYNIVVGAGGAAYGGSNAKAGNSGFVLLELL